MHTEKVDKITNGQLAATIQGLSQEMIKGSPNLLIVEPGRGLVSSHNAIWWNLAIFFENSPSKERLDGSLAKSLPPLILVSCNIHGKLC